ncbi:hypothetical protein MAPG_06449 [Magnaporthiopsis poae ATCC 64411]|uniref:Uncharacterized protein n=1 Tax=Magnaporthiopsis poae (strain ATCC 64411 / 73-15) TaxID=644358 RepID=A0A0C4E222_MAGP6|nr:hypothetical protein MAPG_06449 [Magnaporthiopsis poae ATCC 64411]
MSTYRLGTGVKDTSLREMSRDLPRDGARTILTSSAIDPKGGPAPNLGSLGFWQRHAHHLSCERKHGRLSTPLPEPLTTAATAQHIQNGVVCGPGKAIARAGSATFMSPTTAILLAAVAKTQQPRRRLAISSARSPCPGQASTR